MALTNKDKEDVYEMITSNKSSNVFDGNITEWLFRGLLGLLLFLGNNIRVQQEVFGETLQEVQASVTKIEIDKQYSQKDIESFRMLLAKPRFTQENFEQRISPILQQLNLNTTELNNRGDFMGDTEKRLTKLEFRVEQIIKLNDK